MVDFNDTYILYRIAGRNADDAADAAEAESGQKCVAELWRKATKMATLFEELHAATSTAATRGLRRTLATRVEELYGTDMLCDECMTWMRRRVADVVPLKKQRRRNYNFKNELGIWYEVATKQIRKSGCDACPWHQREEAEWKAMHPTPTPAAPVVAATTDSNE